MIHRAATVCILVCSGKLAAEKADIAVIVVSGADACREDASETKDAKEKLQLSSEKNQENLPDLTEELKWYQFLKEKNTPVLFLVGKADIDPHTDELASYISQGRTRPPCAGKLRR